MRRFVILAIAAIGWISPAVATPISYEWTGTVDRIDPGFPPGVTLSEKIRISLTLDNVFLDQNPAPDQGEYSRDPSQAPMVLAVDIGGETVVGPFQSVTVLDDHSGVDAFEVVTSSEMTGIGFTIIFETTNLGVLNSDAIPLGIDPADFETATFSVDRFPAFEAFAPSFGGTIDAAAVSTPEPDSIAVLGAALIAMGFLSRQAWGARRRAKSLVVQ